MKKLIVLVVSIVFLLSIAGCVRTYVFEKERVDQEITGNRGVIMGDVPPAPKKATPKRTVIGVDVEIPAFPETKEGPPAKVRKSTSDKELWGNRGYLVSREVAPAEAYPYKAERIEKVSIVEGPRIIKAPKKAYFIEYTVRKGDTLSSIAARPEIYGDAGKWKRIYEANKDVLKGPSNIYPGQALRIPMGLEEERTRKSREK